jgi:hypothetical protein
VLQKFWSFCSIGESFGYNYPMSSLVVAHSTHYIHVHIWSVKLSSWGLNIIYRNMLFNCQTTDWTLPVLLSSRPNTENISILNQYQYVINDLNHCPSDWNILAGREV